MASRDLQYDHHKTCLKCVELIRSKHWLSEGWERWYQNNQELAQRSIKQKREKYWQDLEQNPNLKTRHIQARNEGWRLWRENNPEKFHRNMEKARKAVKLSKMESWLRNSGTLTWEPTQIRCGSERKQVDFVSPDHKIWVEVDGSFHFVEFTPKKSTKASLAVVQARDAMLNQECLKRQDVTLIRLDMNCFCGRDRRLKPKWLQWLSAMLLSPQPGIWCCGELYESVPWAQGTCTILKSPTPNTTFCSPTEL
jgi:hypothetical protein